MSQDLRGKQSKKLQEKQRKRLAEQARLAQQRRAARRSNLVTGAIAAVVVLAVTALIVSDRRDAGSTTVPAGAAAAEAGCTGVREFPEQGREHIDIGAQHQAYNSSPPTSGPHYGTPADGGFYPNPLPAEQLVHNLEHGQIVIWYDPQAPEDTIEGIQALVEASDREALRSGAQEPLLAVPYDRLEPGFSYALTAWRHLESCEDYSRAAINGFRQRFQGRGPETVGVPVFGG